MFYNASRKCAGASLIPLSSTVVMPAHGKAVAAGRAASIAFGFGPPIREQRRLYGLAYEQLHHDM